MRGHIVKRAKGSWTVVLDLGRDSAGKRSQRWESIKGPKRLAEKRLAELLHQSDTGVLLDTGKETTDEFLNRWLADHVAHTTRPRTVRYYESITRLHLRPVIGKVQLQKLTPAHVQRVVAGVLDKGLKPVHSAEDLRHAPQGA